MENILTITNISRSFPGVKALDRISLSVKQGEIHALMGENGAGKSTLIKIISGAISPDTGGQISYKGQPILHNSPSLAKRLGIGVVHQEFYLIRELSVAENIMLHHYPSRRGFVDWKILYNRIEQLLQELEFEIDPRSKVKNLSIAEQQMVEITKCLSQNAELIIMDEPTAALTIQERSKLYRTIGKLHDKHLTIIYISHAIDEVFSLADRISILRDGKFVTCLERKQFDWNRLIELMVGRSIDHEFPTRECNSGDKVVLSVRSLSNQTVFRDIAFDLKEGEVLGLAGLVGAGRTELIKALYGADPHAQGEIRILGRKSNICSPHVAKSAGLGFVPENRKEEGLVLSLAVRQNMSLPSLDKITRFGFLKKKQEEKKLQHYIHRLNIKTPSLRQRVNNLSGGNQQKIVLAKWLLAGSTILFMDEPTRGIDVGAKYEIYLLIDELVRSGVSVLLVSSELPELLALADRILVLSNGSITGEFERENFDAEIIMSCAFNLEQSEVN